MKKFFIVLLILVLLPILTLGIFILTFDLNRYREFTAKKLSETLHYPVSIGSMETKLALVPTIQITDFKIMNQDKQAILTIPKMEATVEMAPLLKKQVNIQKISVPTLLMDATQLTKTEENKKATEQPKTEEHPKTESNVNSKIDLSKLIWIKDFQVGKLNLIYLLKDKKETITIENFVLSDMSSFSLKLNYLKKDFDISGSFGMLTNLLGNNPVLPIKLTIKTGGNTLSVNGQIQNLQKMEDIRLELNLTNSKFSDFLKLFGIKSDFNFKTNLRLSLDGKLTKFNLKNIALILGTDELVVKGSGTAEHVMDKPVLNLSLSSSLQLDSVAEKLGLNSFELTNTLKFKDGKIEIDNLKYLANKTDLTGKISLDFNQKPVYLQVNLNSVYLSLKDVLYQKVQKAIAPQKTSGATKVIPEIKIPWDVFKMFNLDGQIKVVNLFLSNNIDDYSSITLRPTLKDGVLNSPIQMALLSGTLNSVFHLNENDKTIQFKMEGKNINLDKVRELNKEFKNVFLNSDISVQTTGANTQEMLENSIGNIVIEIFGGQIVSPWFNELVERLDTTRTRNAFATTQQATNILCGALNVDLEKGVLISQDKIVLQTDFLDLILTGNIDLNKETLDMSMIPALPVSSKTASVLANVMQTIKLTGGWKDIQIGLDTKQLLSTLIQKEEKGSTSVQQKRKTNLCETALGRAVSTPQKKQVSNTKTLPVKDTTAKSKTDFKEQLFKSLSQVLTKKS